MSEIDDATKQAGFPRGWFQEGDSLPVRLNDPPLTGIASIPAANARAFIVALARYRIAYHENRCDEGFTVGTDSDRLAAWQTILDKAGVGLTTHEEHWISAVVAQGSEEINDIIREHGGTPPGEE
jgi:hypothetical protein